MSIKPYKNQGPINLPFQEHPHRMKMLTRGPLHLRRNSKEQNIKGYNKDAN